MCCYGCQAVARAIISAGHTDYYRYRTGSAPTGRELVPDFIEQTRVYDHPEVQKSFVRVEQGNLREAALIMEGIACAACIWLNERHIARCPGSSGAGQLCQPSRADTLGRGAHPVERDPAGDTRHRLQRPSL
jgi:hypothetical protein